jgi:hypothetical protein
MPSDDTIRAVLSFEVRISHYQVNPVADAVELSAMATRHVVHVCRVTGLVPIGVLEPMTGSSVNK